MNPNAVPPPYRTPLPISAPTEWKDAPKVVKGWAYPLSWLSIVVSALVSAVALFNPEMEPAGRIIMGCVYLFLFALSIWLNRALKRGTRAAWTVQMILSIIGLIGFPLGTLINGYILASWFKPETKAWFGIT